MRTAEDYIKAFGHLNRGSTAYGPAPHKLILLLTVIRLAESGHLSRNRIEATDDCLAETFAVIWQEHVHQSGHKMNWVLPFFHLHNEGFWHLHACPHRLGWLNAQESISSKKSLRSAVEYATLDPELFHCLADAAVRGQLRQVLLEELERPALASCPFCWISGEREIVAENRLALAFYDAYPVSHGHTLIIPKRHVSSFFELAQEEAADINSLSLVCRDILQERYAPAGYNLGVNIGKEAGQSIFHCHVHLIPRYLGDVENPRGGVRGVIPGRQIY